MPTIAIIVLVAIGVILVLGVIWRILSIMIMRDVMKHADRTFDKITKQMDDTDYFKPF